MRGMATASQLRRVRLLLERADAEINRLSALPDAEHTGAHRLLDIPPECTVCADIQRWLKTLNQLKALEIQLQAEIARKELVQADQLDAVRHHGARKIDDERILRELRTGDSNKVIAGRLGVAERTVNNYKRKFRAQLI